MPVYQELLDLNTIFHQLPEPPIIINDLANSSEDDKEAIKEMLTTRYSSDMITLLPSCSCGCTKGEFSIREICKYCGTVVKSSIETDIEPTVWFRKPYGVSKLIIPEVWIMLKERFKKSGFNIVQWLTDTTYRPNVKQPLVVSKIVEAGIQRGYNNFVENFDNIMSYLFSLKDFKRDGDDYLQLLLRTKSKIIFSDHIPIPNKSLLIIEKTNVGVYVDPIIVKAVDAIGMLVSIDKNFHDQNPRVKENRTAKALSKLAEFYQQFYKTNLSPKSALFRRHVFGSRTNFAFRAVISSLTDAHAHNSIEVPWGVGITAFRPHIINKLMKMGMSLNQSIGFIISHVEKYHVILDNILKELITESPNGELHVIAQRNPSLLQGSALRVTVSKFKTNPHDHTVGLSIQVVTSLNADQHLVIFHI